LAGAPPIEWINERVDCIQEVLEQRVKKSTAEIPIETAILDTAPAPVYQQIAEKALHLNQLGLSNQAIAGHLGVDGKTVAKALRWVLERFT
jgi:hypothetical protein